MTTKTSDLGDRTKYIGASDMGALIGVSPYASAIDVWRRLVEGATDTAGEPARIGLLLEPVIVQEYEHQTGYVTRRQNLVKHPDYPWLVGHPDRIIVGEPGLMDAKASAYATGYGEPGTDEVPPAVRVQMAMYMGLTRRLWADVAMFKGTTGLSIYRVHHDADLYSRLISVAVDFWEHNVLGKLPPPVDGSDGYRKYLADRFPVDSGTEMVATPEVALLVEALIDAQAAAKVASARVELAKNQLKDVMGEASTLLATAGKVTWKMQAASSYTVERKAERVLRCYPAKGTEERAA
jgi:putative phage-type endonuclease